MAESFLQGLLNLATMPFRAVAGINRSSRLWGAVGSRSLLGKLALPAAALAGFGAFNAFTNLTQSNYGIHSPLTNWSPSPRSTFSGPEYAPTMSFRRNLNADGDLAFALHNLRKG